jgi:hypothetical protein
VHLCSVISASPCGVPVRMVDPTVGAVLCTLVVGAALPAFGPCVGQMHMCVC